MSVQQSGNNRIDALILDYYWNETGRGAAFTYSIDTSGDDGLDANEQAMVREALARWQEVANISFTQVSKKGHLRFSGQDGTGGVAEFKPDWNWDPRSWWNTKKLDHVNIKLGKDSATGRGNRFLEVALHEIGHALGLKHPGNYNGDEQAQGPFLSYAEDHSFNTVMSYNDVGNYGITPMTYDIRAIQYLYGEKASNTGNTLYQFDSVYGYRNDNRYRGSETAAMKLSIWDSSGVDTLDFANLAYERNGYFLNIQEGGILTTQDALEAEIYQPQDNGADTSDIRHRSSTYGTTIAYNTIMDHVVGTSSADTIIGNQVANRLEGELGNDILYGNGGNDMLYGGYGHDSLYGDGSSDDNPGRDSLFGDAGNDVLYGLIGDDRLYGGTGNDTLFGDEGDDVLWGESGSDYLHGGFGKDRMYGDEGNDHYVVDNVGDVVSENNSSDIDRVSASISYRLGANVENLTLLDNAYSGRGNTLNNTIEGNRSRNLLSGDAGNDTLKGNGGNDTLNGNAGDDYLEGGAGDDTLHASAGVDRLLGGAGKDFFDFGSLENSVADQGIDIILDFASFQRAQKTNNTAQVLEPFPPYQPDSLVIDSQALGFKHRDGLLAEDRFVLGTSAVDRNDRFIYHRRTGALSFDVDGSGPAEATHFATFANNAALSHHDFTLV